MSVLFKAKWSVMKDDEFFGIRLFYLDDTLCGGYYQGHESLDQCLLTIVKVNNSNCLLKKSTTWHAFESAEPTCYCSFFIMLMINWAAMVRNETGLCEMLE